MAEKTREAMLVCEAAGYDIVIVETVGVGQSETAVAGMTDMFVLLQLPNAGDDLQAIKKGVMELADLVVINKADLDAAAATRAQAQITSALRSSAARRAARAHDARWHPRCCSCSALKAEGVDAFWERGRAASATLQRSQRRASTSAAASRRWPGCGSASTPACRRAFAQHAGGARARSPRRCADVDAGRAARRRRPRAALLDADRD